MKPLRYVGTVLFLGAGCVGVLSEPIDVETTAGDAAAVGEGEGQGGSTGSGGIGGRGEDPGGNGGSGGEEPDPGRASGPDAATAAVADASRTLRRDGGATPADVRPATGGDAGGGDAPIALICTSQVQWNGRRGATMRPGESCPRCHRGFTIAGTVYPTAHEPNDCNGVNGLAVGLNVVITGANGATITVPVNSAGNFYTRLVVAKPFQAKVVASNGKERRMVLPQMNGACNSCHTPYGANMAPGRIMAP
jgi:hypothetical protein